MNQPQGEPCLPSQVPQHTCFWKWLPKVRRGPCLCLPRYCAIGLGVVQIVIGEWFLGLGGFFVRVKKDYPQDCPPQDCPLKWKAYVLVTLMSVFFISSGSLAIAAAIKKTENLARASFYFSFISASICTFPAFLHSHLTGWKLETTPKGELGEFVANKNFFCIVVLPALIILTVATISAINSCHQVILPTHWILPRLHIR